MKCVKNSKLESRMISSLYKKDRAENGALLYRTSAGQTVKLRKMSIHGLSTDCFTLKHAISSRSLSWSYIITAVNCTYCC